MGYICGDCGQEHKVPKREEDEKARISTGSAGLACVLALVRERESLRLRILAAEPVIGAARLMVKHQMDRHELGSCCTDATPTNAYLLRRSLEEWDASQNPVKRTVVVNGDDYEVGATLTYEEVLRLARQKEGASVVCKPADRRLAGFTMIKGQTVEVSEGMVISCMMTGNA
jgi:hypothetical protein